MKKPNWMDASATSPSGRVSRIAPLASSFECDPARCLPNVRTYVPTYTVAEPAGDRAHLTAHHLRLPFLLSNTGRFSFFFFLQHNRERKGRGIDNQVSISAWRSYIAPYGLDKTPEPNKPALQRARECFSLSLI